MRRTLYAKGECVSVLLAWFGHVLDLFNRSFLVFGSLVYAAH